MLGKLTKKVVYYNMKDIKFYIGPMSKNVVDAILDFTEETGHKIGFIPSRRQVDYEGGYVNNWTTKTFSEYVNGRIPIERDHGGPEQGYKKDGGVKSFIEDSKYLDVIHIDPWKAFPNFEVECKENRFVQFPSTYLHGNYTHTDGPARRLVLNLNWF